MSTNLGQSDTLLDRSIRIMDRVAEGTQPMRFSELLSGCGFNRATLAKILTILCAHRMLEKRESGYVIGDRPLIHAYAARRRDDLPARCRPHLDAISRRFGVTSQLLRVFEQRSVCLDKVMHEHAPAMRAVGSVVEERLVHPWTQDESLHANSWTVTAAIDMLGRRDPSRPFFLQVGFHRPHPPLDPPVEYLRRFEQVELPQSPVVFTKATTTVTGPHARIPVDQRVTRRLDWEVELGVVIGRAGRFISADTAMSHVFGYTVVNDLSARERQKHHKQFFMGKSMDASCPMGPWITTADAIADPHCLQIRCSVNDSVKQESNTRHLIFSIPRIIEELSTVMTLLPGDIIATGTPAGVGFARNPPEYLESGDVVVCAIESLGELRNTVVM